MDELLREITNCLYKFNTFLKQKALSEKEVQEEEENYKDFLLTKEQLTQLLIKLNKYPVNNLVEGNKNLMELHVLVDGLRWYFNNFHQNVINILKNYPDVEKK